MGFRHSDERRAEAIRLYRERTDLGVEDIALMAGVGRRTLQTWARAAGLPPRSPKTVEAFGDEQRALAVSLYLAGEKMYRIEGATGMGQGSIRKAVVDAGHPLRTCHTNGKVDTEEAVRMAKEHGPTKAAMMLGCHLATVQYHVRKQRR